jgi:Flp pilus assembly pilin Flp
MTLTRRFLIDDRGQDLVEYVLLGATVAFASLILANVFPGLITAVYTSWDAATQALWNPQPPAN